MQGEETGRWKFIADKERLHGFCSMKYSERETRIDIVPNQ
jgi:hypothetical protein